jgi:hypothetical protein
MLNKREILEIIDSSAYIEGIPLTGRDLVTQVLCLEIVKERYATVIPIM